MKELLEYLVKTLVNNPQNVRIEEAEDGDEVTYSVYVDADDMGRIIGKGGRIAKAIRAVMKAASFKENKKVNVDIVD